MSRIVQAQDAMAQQGLTAVVAEPERLGTLLRNELGRWKRVVADANIQGE